MVLYGPDYKSGLAGTVAAKTIAPVANGGHRETTLIELTIDDGTTASALIRDVQRHPLTRQIRHIDLYQVLKGHKVKVEIPVRVANVEASKGVKEGGLLTHAARLILVEVQPSDIPEEIVVDAKDLEIDVYKRQVVGFGSASGGGTNPSHWMPGQARHDKINPCLSFSI